MYGSTVGLTEDRYTHVNPRIRPKRYYYRGSSTPYVGMEIPLQKSEVFWSYNLTLRSIES